MLTMLSLGNKIIVFFTFTFKLFILSNFLNQNYILLYNEKNRGVFSFKKSTNV